MDRPGRCAAPARSAFPDRQRQQDPGYLSYHPPPHQDHPGPASSTRRTQGMPSETSTPSDISERLTAALAATWRAIQHHHPDIPPVILTLGTNTPQPMRHPARSLRPKPLAPRPRRRGCRPPRTTPQRRRTPHRRRGRISHPAPPRRARPRHRARHHRHLQPGLLPQQTLQGASRRTRPHCGRRRRPRMAKHHPASHCGAHLCPPTPTTHNRTHYLSPHRNAPCAHSQNP
jgi:hypothetical protein